MQRPALSLGGLRESRSGPGVLSGQPKWTSSNCVTEFRGSLFENMHSRRGVVCSTKTIGDFEKELENAFLNEIYDKKEDNILICPSAFDPEKVVETDRGQGNVVFTNGICLDFDDGDLSPDKFSRLCPNIRMTIYSSFSSSKSSLRFRVYIPTDTTMNARQYRAVVDAILSVIRTGRNSKIRNQLENQKYTDLIRARGTHPASSIFLANPKTRLVHISRCSKGSLENRLSYRNG